MKKELSLLEKATEIGVTRPPRLTITDEDIELCVAWANGVIGLKQVQTVKGFKGALGNASVYNYLLRGLQQYTIKTCKKNKAE